MLAKLQVRNPNSVQLCFPLRGVLFWFLYRAEGKEVQSRAANREAQLAGWLAGARVFGAGLGVLGWLAGLGWKLSQPICSSTSPYAYSLMDERAFCRTYYPKKSGKASKYDKITPRTS